MFDCTLVDNTYFSTAPYCFTATVTINASAADVFDAFEDENSWPEWAMPIQSVDWTSPKPFGVGTTRRVAMSGGLVGDEVFIDWDYPKRMAFCFTHSSQSLIESFAEGYDVKDLGDGQVEVTWTMGMTPKGLGKLTMFLFKPFMGIGLKWMFGSFKKHVEARVSAAKV